MFDYRSTVTGGWNRDLDAADDLAPEWLVAPVLTTRRSPRCPGASGSTAKQPSVRPGAPADLGDGASAASARNAVRRST